MSEHPTISALEEEISALQKIVTTEAATLKNAQDAATAANEAFTKTSAELVKKNTDLTLLKLQQAVKLARKRQAETLELIFELVDKLAYGRLAILGNVLCLKEPPSVDTLEKTVRGLNMEDTTAAEKVNVIYARLNLLKPM
jgi:hypothetical protein